MAKEISIIVNDFPLICEICEEEIDLNKTTVVCAGCTYEKGVLRAKKIHKKNKEETDA